MPARFAVFSREATAHRHVERIRAVLSSPCAVKVPGMAVFAHGDHARAFSLETAVSHRLVVNEEPYLVPLLEYLHREP